MCFPNHSAQFKTTLCTCRRQGQGQELWGGGGAEEGAQRERTRWDFAEQPAGDHAAAQSQAREHRAAEGSRRRAET